MILNKRHSSINGTITYGSDNSKNISSIYSQSQSLVLQWTEGRRLTQIRDMKNHRAFVYNYNDEGLRTKKIITDGSTPIITDYVWGQNGLAGFTQGEDTVVVHYGQDGTPVGFSLNDTVYTYIKNIQGDVLRILYTTGNAVVEYSYDPWGVPTVTGDTELAAINPCSYRGYDYDEETGFYYLQSRYYDPTVGRFISSDDISLLGASGTVMGYNLFAYCENNPIINIDSDGHIVITATMLLCAGIGAAILGTFGGIVGYNLSKKWNVPKEKRWKYVLGGVVIGAVTGGLIGGAIGYVIGPSASSGIVLWSGNGNASVFQAASSFAKQNGLRILEKTFKGRMLTYIQNAANKLLGKDLAWKFMKPLWQAASEQFAKSSSGVVHVFLQGKSGRLKNWQ